MKFITLLASLLLCVSAQCAGIPKYPWCRDWIEKHCATNTVPKEERIFIGHDDSPQYARTIHFHQGIKLREIIDQTPFKKTTVIIWVMHQNPKEGEPSGQFITVKPLEKPEFEVSPLDVLWIWMYEGSAEQGAAGHSRHAGQLTSP
jgi:hypothetical protein